MRQILSTLLGLLGFASLLTGVAAIYWPAALIIGGALVMVIAEVRA